jgi:hypothetical protein
MEPTGTLVGLNRQPHISQLGSIKVRETTWVGLGKGKDTKGKPPKNTQSLKMSKHKKKPYKFVA